MRPRARIRIGTSGWQYPHWRGVVYPRELPTSAWFDFYARHFDTVEVNNTFYRLPSEAAFRHWHDQAPRGFLYALKLSRTITHLKKLKDARESLDRFLAHARLLGRHRGPLLVQLPPRWKPNPGRLDAFLGLLPGGWRVAVEVRDARWLCEAVYAVLRAHDAALVIHDLVEDHPWVETASWGYLRFHGGPAGDYAGEYSEAELAAVAERIRDALGRGHAMYAYFNNDVGGHAFRNALTLKGMLGEAYA
ncbi:MAG: DUF72 domain-containing protein [Gammaproteobacteria bacterium]|nr:MAG: DUF72 domain-containing protein [Gammaproteobacteria bacterium]